MAIKDIDEMTATLSAKGGKEVAMSDPHPAAERSDMMDMMSEKYFGKSYDKLTPKEIELLEENWEELISQREQPEGIMQLASHTGDDVIQSAIIWAAGLPQFGSIGSVLDALNNVDHPHAMDINGLVNAYMDARVDSN